MPEPILSPEEEAIINQLTGTGAKKPAPKKTPAVKPTKQGPVPKFELGYGIMGKPGGQIARKQTLKEKRQAEVKGMSPLPKWLGYAVGVKKHAVEGAKGLGMGILNLVANIPGPGRPTDTHAVYAAAAETAPKPWQRDFAKFMADVTRPMFTEGQTTGEQVGTLANTIPLWQNRREFLQDPLSYTYFNPVEVGLAATIAGKGIPKGLRTVRDVAKAPGQIVRAVREGKQARAETAIQQDLEIKGLEEADLADAALQGDRYTGLTDAEVANIKKGTGKKVTTPPEVYETRTEIDRGRFKRGTAAWKAKREAGIETGLEAEGLRQARQADWDADMWNREVPPEATKTGYARGEKPGYGLGTHRPIQPKGAKFVAREPDLSLGDYGVYQKWVKGEWENPVPPEPIVPKRRDLSTTPDVSAQVKSKRPYTPPKTKVAEPVQPVSPPAPVAEAVEATKPWEVRRAEMAAEEATLREALIMRGRRNIPSRTSDLREAWFNTPEGKRYIHETNMSAFRSADYDKLNQKFTELDMTPQEKIAWRKEMKADAAEERRNARLEEADERAEAADQAKHEAQLEAEAEAKAELEPKPKPGEAGQIEVKTLLHAGGLAGAGVALAGALLSKDPEKQRIAGSIAVALGIGTGISMGGGLKAPVAEAASALGTRIKALGVEGAAFIKEGTGYIPRIYERASSWVGQKGNEFADAMGNQTERSVTPAEIKLIHDNVNGITTQAPRTAVGKRLAHWLKKSAQVGGEVKVQLGLLKDALENYGFHRVFAPGTFGPEGTFKKWYDTLPKAKQDAIEARFGEHWYLVDKPPATWHDLETKRFEAQGITRRAGFEHRRSGMPFYQGDPLRLESGYLDWLAKQQQGVVGKAFNRPVNAGELYRAEFFDALQKGWHEEGRRIATAEVLESPKWETSKAYLDIKKKYGETSDEVGLVRDTLRAMEEGTEWRTGSSAQWKVARQLTSTATLLLSPATALKQFPQGISTMLYTGWRPVLKAYLRSVSDPASLARAANASGAASTILRQRTFELWRGDSPFSEKWTRTLQIWRSDAFQRKIASWAGQEHLRDLHAKLRAGKASSIEKNYLKDMYHIEDLDGFKKQIAPDGGQLNHAGYEAARWSQFASRVIDLPEGVRTNPGIRVVMHLRSFSYQATKMLKDKILMDLRHGNYAVLVKAGIYVGLPSAGLEQLIRMAQDWVRGGRTKTDLRSEAKQGPFLEVVDALSRMSGTGMAADSLRTLTWSDPSQAIASQVLGPTYGQGTRLIAAGRQIATGKPREGITKLGGATFGMGGFTRAVGERYTSKEIVPPAGQAAYQARFRRKKPTGAMKPSAPSMQITPEEQRIIDQAVGGG